MGPFKRDDERLFQQAFLFVDLGYQHRPEAGQNDGQQDVQDTQKVQQHSTTMSLLKIG